jgi:hypothetical protein
VQEAIDQGWTVEQFAVRALAAGAVARSQQLAGLAADAAAVNGVAPGAAPAPTTSATRAQALAAEMARQRGGRG